MCLHAFPVGQNYLILQVIRVYKVTNIINVNVSISVSLLLLNHVKMAKETGWIRNITGIDYGLTLILSAHVLVG